MEFSCEARPPGQKHRSKSNEEIVEESGYSPRKSQTKKQSRKPNTEPGFHEEQLTDESEFWAQSTKQSTDRGELRVFKRVHLQAMSEFLQRIDTFDKAHFLHFDINHTRAKFPQAENYLIERLGRAISRRRQYLQYNEAHHSVLPSRFEGTEMTELTTEKTDSDILSATALSSLPTILSIDMDATQADPITDIETSSYTTYDPSLSIPLGLRTPSLDINIPFGLPSLSKKLGNGQFFECPLCFKILVYHGDLAWRTHVLEELHPYVCTFKDCASPDVLFARKEEWFDHEMKKHRHQEDLSGCVCPLCKNISFRSLRHLLRHLGGHQAELALFALPMHIFAEEDSDSDSETPAILISARDGG
jgi:hypothetical protein